MLLWLAAISERAVCYWSTMGYAMKINDRMYGTGAGIRAWRVKS
jgi:hypothetical protein